MTHLKSFLLVPVLMCLPGRAVAQIGTGLIPECFDGPVLQIDYASALDLRIADLDQDSDLDLVYWGNGTGFHMRAFRNTLVETGVLGFEEWPAGQGPLQAINVGETSQYYDVAFIDLDDSGEQLDLVVASIGSKDRIYRWMEAPGAMNCWAPEIELADQTSEYWCCAPSDPAAGHLPCRAYDPTGEPGNCDEFLNLTCADQQGALCTQRLSTGVIVADFNGDGLDDAAFCYRDARPAVFVNDGSCAMDPSCTTNPLVYLTSLEPPCDEDRRLCPDGGIECDQFNPFPGAAGRDIQCADMDMDGDLDLIVDRRPEPNQGTMCPVRDCKLGVKQPIVYRNTFEECAADPGCVWGVDRPYFEPWYKLLAHVGGPEYPNHANSIEVEDLDGDGLPDIIVTVDKGDPGTGPISMKTRLYYNVGDGTVGVPPNPPVSHCQSGTYEYRRPTRLLNDGFDLKKTFAEVEDVNADGSPDLVIGYFRNVLAPDKLFYTIGTGSGGFPRFKIGDRFKSTQPGPAGSPAPSDETRYGHFADLDNDGDLEYLEANFNGPFQRIFINTTY